MAIEKEILRVVILDDGEVRVTSCLPLWWKRAKVEYFRFKGARRLKFAGEG